MGDVVQGYTTLASSLLGQWSDHAAQFAAKVDGGELDGPAMTAELMSCATLATRNGLELMEEAIRAANVLGSGLGAEEKIVSQAFHAPAGAALKLAGPLDKGGGLGTVPVSAVTIEPPKLGPGQTAFTLSVDARELRGGTYVGTVEAFTDVPLPVIVWVTIP